MRTGVAAAFAGADETVATLANTVGDAASRLRLAFLGGWPLDELISLTTSLPGWPSEAAQSELVLEVLDCPEAREFPPNTRRTARYIKALTRALEADVTVEEVDERLLLMYAALPAALDGGTPELAYLHYSVEPGAAPIVIRAADRWGAGTETGCVVWDAGAWLASFALAQPDLFRARCVLELGSGCGLLSCALARHCRPRTLIATDLYHPTLDNLRQNLQRNGLADAPVLAADEVGPYLAKQSREGEVAACCVSLDWLDPSLSSANLLAAAEPPDVIVAADCVYGEELVDGLVRTLRALLVRPHAVALVASKRRNERTWSAFQDALARHGLHSAVEPIDAEERGHGRGRGVRADLWRLCDPSDITLLRLTRTWSATSK